MSDDIDTQPQNNPYDDLLKRQKGYNELINKDTKPVPTEVTGKPEYDNHGNLIIKKSEEEPKPEINPDKQVEYQHNYDMKLAKIGIFGCTLFNDVVRGGVRCKDCLDATETAT